MTLKYADRVRETTVTTGTGTVNLAGAEAKYQAFNDVLDTNDTCYYAIVHRGANEWEVGYGTFTDAAPDTLARTKVIASSNANAAVSFSAGTKDVFITLPAIEARGPGFIEMFAGTTAPDGTYWCDGSNYSRTTDKALFDQIGTTWGIGDGSTTFGVPDFRRRTPVGSGGSGTATLAATVGSTGGAETHTLSTAELATHQHTYSATSGTVSADHSHSGTTGGRSADHSHGAGSLSVPKTSGAGGNEGTVDDGGGPIGTTAVTGSTAGESVDHTHGFSTGGISANHTHGVSGTTDNAGSGTAHNNMQPSAVCLFVIRR